MYYSSTALTSKGTAFEPSYTQKRDAEMKRCSTFPRGIFLKCTSYEVYVLIICNVFVSTHPIVVAFFYGAAFVCDVTTVAKSHLIVARVFFFVFETLKSIIGLVKGGSMRTELPGE